MDKMDKAEKARPGDILIAGYANLDAFKNNHPEPIMAMDPIFDWDEALKEASLRIDKYPIIIVTNLIRVTALINPDLGLTLREAIKIFQFHS